MVRILEKLGHQIDYPEELTCCGQPGFNSGCWVEARPVAEKVLHRLKDADVVVIASGSCGAMIKKFYPDLFCRNQASNRLQKTLAPKVYEFSQFVVNRLGVTDLGASFPAKVTFPRRLPQPAGNGHPEEPRKLMANVRGLELIEMSQVVCCGFGGTFSAKFPAISTAMGEVKMRSGLETKAEYITSAGFELSDACSRSDRSQRHQA